MIRQMRRVRSGRALLWVLLPVAGALASAVGAAQSGRVTTRPTLPDRRVEVPWHDPVEVSFLREGLGLYWVPEWEVLDAKSREWIRQLGSDACLVPLGPRFPVEPSLRLIVLSETERKVVNWPTELRGMVQIHTPEQALEFVRLFSSFETYYRFPEFRYLEVSPSADAPDTTVRRARQAATMRASDFKKLGLRPPVVIAWRESFRIRRSVAEVTAGAVTGLAILDETVTAEGNYTVRVLWREDVPPDSTLIRLPCFM